MDLYEAAAKGLIELVSLEELEERGSFEQCHKYGQRAALADYEGEERAEDEWGE